MCSNWVCIPTPCGAILAISSDSVFKKGEQEMNVVTSFKDIVEALSSLTDEELAKLNYEVWHVAYMRANSPKEKKA